jgi:hypothetical protein
MHASALECLGLFTQPLRVLGTAIKKDDVLNGSKRPFAAAS